MLYLGSIRMDHVINESCYRGTILQRNSFVKFHGKNISERHYRVVSLQCYNEVFYKEAALLKDLSTLASILTNKADPCKVHAHFICHVKW